MADVHISEHDYVNWKKVWAEYNTPPHFRSEVHGLADQGHFVVGVEIVELPVRAFFKNAEIDYVIEVSGVGKVYRSVDDKIRVFVCDLFHLSRDIVGLFDVVWDRAAFVAVTKEDRERYVCLLKTLMAGGCRYLLSTVDIKMASKETRSGPPYITSSADLQELFGDQYTVSFVDRLDCSRFADPKWNVLAFHEILYRVEEAINQDC